MKPRIFWYAKIGAWFCYDENDMGTGETLKDAYDSWLAWKAYG
jgi:hypothetical protein